MVKKILFVILFISGCDDFFPTEIAQETLVLDLWMDMEYQDGYYLYDYPNNRPHSYTKVLYQSLPMERVSWSSADSFYVYHQNRWFGEPIINYSTYSRTDGSGQQMIYTNPTFIGDTLTIMGCIRNRHCEKISFIVY